MNSKDINAEFSAFITPAVEEHIDWIVNATSKRFNFNHQDREDLRQTVLLTIYNSMGDWDRTRGSRFTFACYVIKNAVRNYTRTLGTRKHNLVKYTLDEPCVRVIDGETEYMTFREIVIDTHPWKEAFKKIDVSALLDSLPKRFKRIGCLIAEGYSMHEISDGLGVTDYSFFYKLMPEFRRRCTKFLDDAKKFQSESATHR